MDGSPLDLLQQSGGFGIAFAVVALLVAAVFVVVIATMVRNGVRYAAASPQTAHATCVGKRVRVSGGGTGSSASTWYYATFDLADGRRLELGLSGRDHGLLAEGDRGELTWRDTVFKDFRRSTSSAVRPG